MGTIMHCPEQGNKFECVDTWFKNITILLNGLTSAS